MSTVLEENWAEESDVVLGEQPPLGSSPRSSPPESTVKPNSKATTGEPCALAYLEGGSVSSTAAKKLLPAIRSKNEGRETVVNDSPLKPTFQKDFIPLDILTSLTQIPSPPSKEQLGPPTKFKKNSTAEKPTIRKRPANVWNFNKGREKLKHLVDNPPCLCGAGRDISFLYDALTDKKVEKAKTSSQTTPCPEGNKNYTEQVDGAVLDGSLIPTTLVPAEYHLVKNPGVLGLEFSDDVHTTHLKEHEEHLTIFPSMKPTGRQEVMKLKHALETLLSKAGVDDESKELTGPTQIHNLLEIVRKEQNIYNIVFNELIRQCTVECAERGELLAELRKKYAQLLDRVPRQVMSLHQEVLAQRALDRRLTEELVRFKASVSSLTNELAVVKAHDHDVTKQAMQVQKELNEVLMASEKNANLLEEYHELYELQRRRLETFVRTLTEERDLWGSAAYILALKVTDHHKLNIAKRLHLHERAWSKLARHFSLSLSQRDSEQLQDVVTNFQSWKDLAEKFNNQLTKREASSRDGLLLVVQQLEKWKREFERVVSPEEGRVQALGKELVENLLNDMKGWEELCNKEAERFVGGNLLSCNDQLHLLHKKVENWTDVALKVFRRHQENGQNVSYNKEMTKINEQVERLHQQFQIRASGENGVAKGLIDISNPMESWCNKLSSVVNGSEEMLDPEWIRLSDQVGSDWLENMKEIIDLFGATVKDAQGMSGQVAENEVNFDELCKLGKTWLTDMTNGIESEDGKLMQIVSDLHSTMLRWMITVLLRLAPDIEDRDLEEISTEEDLKGSLGGGEILLESTSHEIKARAGRLILDLRTYSKTIKDCCASFVMETMLEKKDRYEDDAEVEYNDLKRLATECEGWIKTSELLVKQVLGEIPLHGVELGPIEDTPALGPEWTKKERTGSQNSERTVSTSRSTPTKSVEQEPSTRSVSVEKDEAVGTPRDYATPDDIYGSVIQAPVDPETEKVLSNQQQEAEKDTGDIDRPISSEENKMRVLADDDTVRTRVLKDGEIQEIASKNQDPRGSSSKQTGDLDQFGKERDYSGNVFDDSSSETQKIKRSPSSQANQVETPHSFEALETVEKLQNELIETEHRAQRAEERALSAETELKLVQEKLRALERAASRPQSAQTSQPSAKPSTSGKGTASPGSSARASARQPSRGSSGAASGKR